MITRGNAARPYDPNDHFFGPITKEVHWNTVLVALVTARFTDKNNYNTISIDPPGNLVPTIFDPSDPDTVRIDLDRDIGGKELKDCRVVMVVGSRYIEDRKIDDGGDFKWEAVETFGDSCFYPGGYTGDPRHPLNPNPDPNEDSIYVGDDVCGHLFNNNWPPSGPPAGVSWITHQHALDRLAFYSGNPDFKISRGVVLKDGSLGEDPPINTGDYTDGGVLRKTNQWTISKKISEGPTYTTISERSWLVNFSKDVRRAEVQEISTPTSKFPLNYTNTVNVKVYRGGHFNRHSDDTVVNTGGTLVWQDTKSVDWSTTGVLVRFDRRGFL
jgi:hypothetical protein